MRNIKQRSWIKVLVFLAALEIMAIAINFFYGPFNIAGGGSTGISILIEAVWGIDRSISVFVINTAMLILAAIFLGKKVTKNILAGSLLLPILMEITPSFKITDNKLMAVMFGGALMGFGISLLYRIDASSGGTTIPPIILKKYFYLSPTITLTIIDTIVIVANIFVDGMDAFLLAIVSQVVTTITMHCTETGPDKKYQIRVMSNKYLGQIQDMLKDEYQGLTIYNVTGGYSNEERKQLLTIVDPREYGPLISKIHKIDKDAFIITENVAKVHGGRWGI